MIHQRTHSTAALFLVSDLGAAVVAFFAAWLLRSNSNLIPGLEADPNLVIGPYLTLLPFIVLAWPTVFFFQGMYQSKVGKSRVEQTVSIFIAVTFASLMLWGLTAWYRPVLAASPSQWFTFSRAFLGIFSVINFFLTATGRFSIQAIIRSLRRRGHNLTRILVIGGGRLGREVTQKILNHRELGFEVVGILDDRPSERFILGRPVLGSLHDLPVMLEKYSIDQVMIALPLEAYRKTMRILEQVGKECGRGSVCSDRRPAVHVAFKAGWTPKTSTKYPPRSISPSLLSRVGAA